MPKVKSTSSSRSSKDIRTPISPENAEAQCISLAMDLVRQRLIDGTASSQETTHFLKLGSQKNQLELEKMRAENALTFAKIEEIESRKRSDKMFEDAIHAIRDYQGRGDMDNYEDLY